MAERKKSERLATLTITIQGREVVLHFAPEPNSRIAVQVKQALLGAWLPANK